MDSFTLEFNQLQDGAWAVDIFDIHDEWISSTEGQEIKQVLHHALHEANPLIAAGVFADHLEWSETHKLDGNDPTNNDI